jgi:hypothetical protein
VTYRLSSVIVHDGSSSSSGHYYAYINVPKDGWFIFDDGDVMQSSEDELRRTLFTSLTSRTTAYLLFYKRDDEHGRYGYGDAEDCREGAEASLGLSSFYSNGAAETKDASIVRTSATDEGSGMVQFGNRAAELDLVRDQDVGNRPTFAETPVPACAGSYQSTKGIR